MPAFAEHYGDKPPGELLMLFQRILNELHAGLPSPPAEIRNALFFQPERFSEARREDGSISTCSKSTLASLRAKTRAAPKINSLGERRFCRPLNRDTTITRASTKLYALLEKWTSRNGSRHGLPEGSARIALLPRRPTSARH